MESAQHHQENKWEIYFEAIEEVGINPKKIEKEVDAIAFSQAPGLAPCLIEGMKFAKELSQKYSKPLIPVNHCIAHLEIGKLTGAKDPIILYTSGANTQVIAYEGKKYHVFGETLDIGVGNFIDTFARYAEMGFPGGPKIEKIAKRASEKDYILLPYNVKGEDIALSGILTNLRQKIEKKEYKLSSLAYSLQETVFAMLVETAERALAHTGKKELLLGGGVACNLRLQEMCKKMCEERGAKLFVPEKKLLVDQGAMIAFLGEIMFKSGIRYSGKKAQKLDINPRQRTDQVKVTWKKT
jgi:N6-L-threonylcarbamoyladenine synthase